MNNKIVKKIISLVLCAVMVLSYLPGGILRTDAAAVKTGGQTVDGHTLDQWKLYFGLQEDHAQNVALSTEYAGGVWTDKSVFDPENIPGQLTAAKYNGNGISIADEGDNFLVALSAIASNKQVVGYSTRPTDTMLVLDLSGSMEGSVSAMVAAANEAMGDLLKLNNYNRVGVVLYSGNSNFGNSGTNTATVLLPLNRYTTTAVSAGGVPQYITCNNREQVSVAETVRPNSGLGSAKSTVGATYTQNGIYQAMMQLVNASNKVIPNGTIQAGTTRLPILVLMSDGEPTAATKSYTNVATSDVGDGSTGTDTSHDIAFLTQLTMAYAKREIDTAYGTDSLLYTLGYSVENNDYAKSVLSPAQYTTNRIDSLWNTYNRTAAGSRFNIRDRGSQEAVTKHTDAAGKYSEELANYRYYTDQYFPAAKSSDLNAAFQSIVDEIILQAKYYPTYVEQDHDHDGYLTFVDKIGSYMEVSDVPGIVVGDRLFSGAALAAKFVDGSFGTMEKPTATGSALIDSIMTRLNIDSIATAKALAVNAYNHGQLGYTDDRSFSHYLGWFSDANGNYVDFWHEGMTDAQIAEVAARKNATHVVKSYLFLGDTTVIPGVNNTDMMYMSVRVATDIATMNTIVTWRIPASLVPTVTYDVSVEVNSDGQILRLADLSLASKSATSPIRLLYEVGLRSDIADWNLTEKVDAAYVQENGYTFYSNKWAENPDDITRNTYSHFEPSVQNERYYYTQDTLVLAQNGGSYAPHTGAQPSGTGYFRSFEVFERLESGALRIHTHYEPISAEALASVRADGSNWVVPKDTIHRYYDNLNAPKDANTTGTMGYTDHPFVVKSGSNYYTYSTQGNNGKFTTAPATGIRLTKSLAADYQTENSFTFVIAGEVANAMVVRLDENGNEASRTALPASGEVSLTAGETVYIVGLTAGSYTVTEKVAVGADYHVQSVQVNGQTVSGTAAQLTLAHQTVTPVEFTNAKQGYGSLVVSKDVNYPAGFTPTAAHEAKTFTVDVTFAGDIESVIAPEGAVANGNVYTLTLKDGESATFSMIKHGVSYTVTERDNPAGYSLTEVRYSNGDKTVSSAVTDEAHVVNAYSLSPVSVPLKVVGVKSVTGGWPEGAAFTLRLLKVNENGSADTGLTATVTAGSTGYEIDLSSLTFEAEGVYTFRVVEDIPAERLPDMAYDRSFGQFSVTVEDSDADGKLEVAAVTADAPAALSGDANGYTVTKNFTNVVTRDIVYLDVQKRVKDAAGKDYPDHRADITFGLFASTDSAQPEYYVSTDAGGAARFAVPVSQDSLNGGRTWYLREIAPAVENRVVGMRYDESWIAAVRITWDVENNVAVAEYASVTGGDWTPYTENETVFTHTNTYEPNVYSTPEIVLSGVKTLNGSNDLGGREFSFSLYKTTAAFVIQGEALQTVKNSGNAITFDGIAYTTPGLHYLSVKEDASDLGGITTDERHYHITVLVEKYTGTDGTTRLRVAEGYPHIAAYGETGEVAADALNFNNRYGVSGTAEVVLEGTKTLTGRQMLASEFRFRLEEVADENGTALTDGAVLYAENGTAIDGAAVFRFEPIVYSREGVHYYRVTEVAGPDGIGVTYSQDAFIYKVTVSDNGQGGLTTEKSVVGGRDVLFANSYKVREGSANMAASKELYGKVLGNEQFSFRLLQTQDDYTTPLAGGVDKTVKNNGVGSIDFGRLTYGTEGTFYYVISENIPEEKEAGIVYDDTVYYITVRVVDDKKGQMQVFTSTEMVVEENGQKTITPVSSVVFYNRYVITGDAKAVLRGVKYLNGRALADGEFTFQLYKTDANYGTEGVTPVTATNENGLFDFELDFTAEDVGTVHHYLVKEDKAGQTVDGVTYSTQEYRIAVEVKDNGAGGVELAISGNDLTVTQSEGVYTVNGISFTNEYDCEDVQVELTVKKTMTGDRTDPSGFEFGLYTDLTKEPVARVTSDADGVVSFKKLELSLLDVQKEAYVFYIREILPVVDGKTVTAKDNVTYDEKVYTVALTVSHDGKGNLTATYTVDGAEVDAATWQFAFTNSYKKPPANNPQTGDVTPVAMLLAVMLLSGFAAAAMVIADRKRRSA